MSAGSFLLACPLLYSLKQLVLPSPVQNNRSINSRETSISWRGCYPFQLTVRLKDKRTRVYATISHMDTDKDTPMWLYIPMIQYLCQGNPFWHRIPIKERLFHGPFVLRYGWGIWTIHLAKFAFFCLLELRINSIPFEHW